MQVVIALALLWARPVYADWQYTKWGMTPEQVIGASGGSVSRVPEAQQKGRSRPGLAGLLSGTYSSGDFDFKADFQFSRNKLEMVGLELLPYDYNRCKRLENTLLSKYGLPFEIERGPYPWPVEYSCRLA